MKVLIHSDTNAWQIQDQALVAMAKSGFVFFDYINKRVVPMPEAFFRKFENVNWIG